MVMVLVAGSSREGGQLAVGKFASHGTTVDNSVQNVQAVLTARSVSGSHVVVVNVLQQASS